MPYAITDLFNDKQGRWNQTAPWDATISTGVSAPTFLGTQQHVDLRNFRPRGQKALTLADLDLLTQTQVDVAQTSLELQSILSDENWVKTGTGMTGLTYGKLPSRSGWSGLQSTTTGVAINSTFTSAMTEVIDISAQDNLSIIFPDYNSFDGTTSSIQLTSNPTGVIGTASYDSAVVQFSSNNSIMPQLRLALSLFTTAAGANFSLAKVTGISVTVAKAASPVAGLTFTMMAIRALKAAWTESSLDFETRFGHLVTPVTLDGNVYGGSVANGTIFIRGDKSKSDPIPADGACSLYFNAGGEINPSGGTNYNYLRVAFREIYDTVAVTGSWFEARFRFNTTGSFFEIRRSDYTQGGGVVTTTLATDATPGTLVPGQSYVLQVTWSGTTAQGTLYTTDALGNPQTFVWKSPVLVHQNLTYRNGRVGFAATFLDRDAYIDSFQVAPTGYAKFRYAASAQRTPVDGAQLSAASAADLNLFTGFTGSDIFVDQTKTLSGNGSYRTQVGIQTNQFTVDDWTNTYLSCSIWVPSSVSAINQPQVKLVTPSGNQSVSIPTLQPSQWNSFYVDLGNFRNLLTATSYYLQFNPAAQPDTALGPFWVDNVIIGRRRVAWRVRAAANAPFRSFKGLINSGRGAVHFLPEERGTLLQVEAEALTEDAWVGPFRLLPRHAQLGNPVYDQAFQTR